MESECGRRAHRIPVRAERCVVASELDSIVSSAEAVFGVSDPSDGPCSSVVAVRDGEGGERHSGHHSASEGRFAEVGDAEGSFGTLSLLLILDLDSLMHVVQGEPIKWTPVSYAADSDTKSVVLAIEGVAHDVRSSFVMRSRS